MQTRSSSRLAHNQSSNPSASTNPNPKGRNRRHSKQRIENLDLDDLSEPIVTMADQRTMAQLLQAPTEGYEDAIVVPAITAGNFELKHVVAKVSTSSSTPAISSDVAELKDMVRAVRALLLDKKNQSSAPAHSLTPAPVKVVEPNCVTCGGTHSYQNCPATNGNIYQDNIQEYVSQAAAANYNDENIGFRPQMVANQIRPLGFPPHQNNQNNFNRGNKFSQNRGAPIPQTQSVSKTDFESYVKANDAVLRNMQNQGQSLQIQMANLTDMLSKFVSYNTASSLGSGTLPSNTITNPKEDLKGITIRSVLPVKDPQFLLRPNKEPR
nr:hypothetical protein [Tanacetum cinerariifolium]